MNTAKDGLRMEMERLDAGGKIQWARETVFIPQVDGSCLRRVTRQDGSVEQEHTIAPVHSPFANK